MKKLSTSAQYIISIISLNLLILCLFSFLVARDKLKIAETFNQKLEEKSSEISTVVNLINAYISTQDTFNSIHIKHYTDMLKKLKQSVNQYAFSTTNIIIADKNGMMLFSTLPCPNDNLICSIAHRDYFKSVMQDSDDKIYVSPVVEGVTSKKEAITFSSATYLSNNGGKIITVVGLDIAKLLQSLDLKSYISIVPITSNPNLT